MFIRAINRKLKNGKTSTTYQAIDSFRDETGKVKQRVVNLGEFSNPRDTLKQELGFLRKMEERLNRPLSEYKEVISARGMGLQVVAVSTKEAEKKREKLRMQYEKQRKRIGDLESVASCIADIKSTTFFESEEQKKKAQENIRQIRELLGLK